MSATKILWDQPPFVLMVVLTFQWGVAEWTAWRPARPRSENDDDVQQGILMAACALFAQ